MNYISLYRKYRPKNFDEVVGQNEIKLALSNAIVSNTFSHAYIFSGPRGTGKTSLAKIFAKTINCDNKANYLACEQCNNCLEINNGSAIDIFEIDAASNNGVDEIREIRDKVRFLPIKLKYKVYIIDEVHMLTTQAFNALLKTLEEPPSHVIFILATTESHKIPMTIVSRCQQYNFGKLSTNDLQNQLEKILKLENISYEKDAIEQIALLADGAARDALSILEQVIMFSNNNVSLENVNKIFSITSKKTRFDILHMIFTYQSEKLLTLVKELYQIGTNFELLLTNLLDMIKELLEYKHTKNTNFLAVLKIEEASKLLSLVTTSNLFGLVDIFSDALYKAKMQRSMHMYFELIMLKCLDIFSNVKVENNVDNISINENVIENNMINNQYQEKQIDSEDSVKIQQSDDSDEAISVSNNQYESVSSGLDQEISQEITSVNVPENNEQSIEQNINNITSDIKDDEELILVSLNENDEDFISSSKTVTNSFEIEMYENLEEFQDAIKQKEDIFNLVDINFASNEIFNILLKASKDKREFVEEKITGLFNNINKAINYNKLISFYNHKIVAASEKGFIIVTETKPEANWILHEILDWEFRTKLFEVLNFDFIVLALSKLEWNNLKVEYARLKQLSKVPQPVDINIELYYQSLLEKKINNLDESKELIENGKDIFGNIKIVD